jgi:hypothetical protein
MSPRRILALRTDFGKGSLVGISKMKLVGTDALYAEPVPIVLPKRLATALYLEAIRTLASGG